MKLSSKKDVVIFSLANYSDHSQLNYIQISNFYLRKIHVQNMAKLTEMRPHIVDRRPTKINQEREGEIEKGKAVELSAMDRASGRKRMERMF